MHKYIEIFLNSSFPQSDLLSADKFLSFLRSIGLKKDKSTLEYYHRIGILKPVAKLKRIQVRNQFPKYDIVDGSIFSLGNYFRNGFLKLVNEYEPWEDLKDGYENKAILYYHPFQFLSIRRLVLGLDVSLDLRFFEKENIEERLKIIKERLNQGISSSKKSYEEFWIPRIGLLILLDEAYGPYIKSFRGNIDDRSTYIEKWNNWRFDKFDPFSILKTSALSIDEIKEFHKSTAVEGIFMDPLSRWYVLQRIIKRSELLRLEDNALYSQYCYELAMMISYFIYELTGEKLSEPDDIVDGTNGKWKREIYGEPFDYASKKTQKHILDSILVYRPFLTGIIFEGKSEQRAIELILNALRIDKERDGFFLFDAEGQKNIVQNLKLLYDFSKMEDIELILILDNDNKVNKIKNKLKNYVKAERIKIWQKDFEYDNFGTEEVLREVNKKLSERGLQPIKKEEVRNRLNAPNCVLMHILESIAKETNKGIKLWNLISKKNLTESLISTRIKEIEYERFSSDGWKPKLPIEKVLHEAFQLISRISSANMHI